MGTRMDLYVGRGKSAEWLGSYAWDGYPSGEPHENGLLSAADERDWRAKVGKFLANDEIKKAATTPDQGWPWPWETSRLTDYSYTFDDGQVWVSCFGRTWVPGDRFIDKGEEPDVPEWENDDAKVEFPDMTDKQKVAMDGRSGLIIITAKS